MSTLYKWIISLILCILVLLPSEYTSKFLKIYLLNFHFSKAINHKTWAFWENRLNHMTSKYMYIPPISLYLIREFYILRCSLEISTLTLSIRTPWILSLQNSSALFLRDGMEVSDSAGNWLVVKVIKFEFTSKWLWITILIGQRNLDFSKKNSFN